MYDIFLCFIHLYAIKINQSNLGLQWLKFAKTCLRNLKDSKAHLYHLESRWRNSHVLVYHGPLLSHLLGVASHPLSLWCNSWFPPFCFGDRRVLLMDSLGFNFPTFPPRGQGKAEGSEGFSCGKLGFWLAVLGEKFLQKNRGHESGNLFGWDQTKCKWRVNLRDFPYNSALFGLII